MGNLDVGDSDAVEVIVKQGQQSETVAVVMHVLTCQLKIKVLVVGAHSSMAHSSSTCKYCILATAQEKDMQSGKQQDHNGNGKGSRCLLKYSVFQ